MAAALGAVGLLERPELLGAQDAEATIGALQTQVADADATIGALQTQVAKAQPTATPRPKATPTPTPSLGPGSITEFGEQGTVHYLLDRWRLTFDSNVEVRYFIGDHSIVPRRGQFLVVWFMQQAIPAKSLPLGNFQLYVLEPDGDDRIATDELSKEGTAALILTEQDWIPDLMQSDFEYRTGIVFDIRPEDVHFRLVYRSADLQPGKSKNWVDIEFTA